MGGGLGAIVCIVYDVYLYIFVLCVGQFQTLRLSDVIHAGEQLSLVPVPNLSETGFYQLAGSAGSPSGQSLFIGTASGGGSTPAGTANNNFRVVHVLPLES